VIGLDTNALARYFVAEQGADDATLRQRHAARQLIESGQALFLPKTLALELEWVLRGYDGFSAEQVQQVYAHLLAHPASPSKTDRPWTRQWRG
jgi:predicted nucleic-acid-binding protein